MKYKWMLKNVQLRTPEKDDYKAAQEVAAALKKSKKFDGTKIFLCRQVAGIAVPKGEKQDPYVHSFTFVSNDKDELQKLADNFNKILFPNHEKDELLGVNVRKNTDNYEDVFESKKIKAEGQYDDAPPNPDLMEIVEPLKECLEAYNSWFSDVVTDEDHRNDFESFLESLKQFANEMDCPSTSGGKDEYAKLIKAITKFEDDCDKYFEYWDGK